MCRQIKHQPKILIGKTLRKKTPVNRNNAYNPRTLGLKMYVHERQTT